MTLMVLGGESDFSSMLGCEEEGRVTQESLIQPAGMEGGAGGHRELMSKEVEFSIYLAWVISD